MVNGVVSTIKKSVLSILLMFSFAVLAQFEPASKNSDNSNTKVRVEQLAKRQLELSKEYGDLDTFLSDAAVKAKTNPNWVLAGAQFFLQSSNKKVSQKPNYNNQNHTHTQNDTQHQNTQLQLLTVEASLALDFQMQAEQTLKEISLEDSSLTPVQQLKWYKLSVVLADKKANFISVSQYFDNAQQFLVKATGSDDVALSHYQIIDWYLFKFDFYISVNDISAAEYWLEMAESQANDSARFEYHVWVSKKRVQLHIAKNEYYLAEIKAQDLIHLIKRINLNPELQHVKLSHANLLIQRNKLQASEKVIEEVYLFAEQNRNRSLQLQSLILLVDLQIMKQDVDYARSLLNALEKIQKMPNAVNGIAAANQTVLNKIKLLKAQLALLSNDIESATRFLNTIVHDTEFKPSHFQSSIPAWDKLDEYLGFNSLPVDALKLQAVIAATNQDWQLLNKHQGVLRYIDSRNKERQFKRELNYAKTQHNSALQAQALKTQEQEEMNLNLTNAIIAMTDKLSSTRWWLLLLVFGLVLFIYNAVLRRQTAAAEKWPHLQFQRIERRLNQLMASKISFSLVLFDLCNMKKLIEETSISSADALIDKKLTMLASLNPKYIILPMYGHRYLLVAPDYDSKQAHILISRIEKILTQGEPALTAAFATQEVNQPIDVVELLNQIESNLPNKNTKKV